MDERGISLQPMRQLHNLFTAQDAWNLIKQSTIYHRLVSTGNDQILVKNENGEIVAFPSLEKEERDRVLNSVWKYARSLRQQQIYSAHTSAEVLTAICQDPPLPSPPARIFSHQLYLSIYTTPDGVAYLDSRHPFEDWTTASPTYVAPTTISKKVHEQGIEPFRPRPNAEAVADFRWAKLHDKRNSAATYTRMWRENFFARAWYGRGVQYNRADTNGLREEILGKVDDYTTWK
ncbi:hypothetical protein MBLNU230_g0167t1 [Neophaeotheca triangularis]